MSPIPLWFCWRHNNDNMYHRDCRVCRFHMWYYDGIGFYLEIPIHLMFLPLWWIRVGRKMDSKGFMPDEENYKKGHD